MPSLPARLLGRRALLPPRIQLRALHHAVLPLPPAAPPPTALSALASRLALPPSAPLHAALLACLTHPSYRSQQLDSAELAAQTNELLATLGNSLLGLFASEHLSAVYPYLPTKPLQHAVTAYVGPASCLSVARSLGVAVQGGGNTGLPGLGAGSSSAGVAVRWSKTALAERNWRDTRGEAAQGPLKVPVGKRFKKYIKEEDQDVTVQARRETHEDVVASAVRAFVGLIYQEQGIHAARAFTHAHFLSRALDLSSLITPTNPMQTLSSVVSSHLSSTAGVPASSSHTLIQPRLLASTGTASQAPLFLIGLFLPSGIKLAEGHGSSKAMAQHRAAVNALQSIFFMRGDQESAQVLGIKGLGKPVGEFGEGLPSSAHEEWVFDDGKVVKGEEERSFEGVEWGGKEVLPGSRR
ncbi:hypothetical protein CNC05030 [Cryptococcus gattii WM276]|uniref:Large ribosomal subunit protein mL44 n=2 Tax=Cryptococcus gattii species complex TaxID=1884637 RepID=E6R1Z0_CRYGW|nr:uncharacterized protein CGB_C7350C [Cryptococcus gattii WM276]ADV21257.1 hypothetical protein CNC05030 [Cryptococcus gattii WM276]KJE02028.1 hypothetical protein I311_04388 [Cryptococcus gattii NT-10]